MLFFLLLAAIIILTCLIANKFSDKLGLPALLLFMGLGMFFGSDGIVKIPFSDYALSNDICTIGLILIMFYGGFCTNWEAARPTAVKSVLLSTVGVIITALLTAAFCHFFLGFGPVEALLTGAVLGSTDAASVFSILRSRQLNLRDGTASLLEMESGSNDPVAYMLTMTGLLILQGASAVQIPIMFFKQVVFGVAIGCGIAFLSHWIYRRFRIIPDGMGNIYLTALMLLSYTASELLGGNGFLSTYLFGIIMGNLEIQDKTSLISFFDGLSSLAQIAIFFLLGLLSFPHNLPQVFFTAVAVALFLLLAARPVAVFSVLKPFRCSTRQCLFVSWSGLRGAASIVFAVMVLNQGVTMESDLFHIVFLVSLISVAFQGSLLPFMAEKLHMIDETQDVRKTFNDYQERASIHLIELRMNNQSAWVGKCLKEIALPHGLLALRVQRDQELLTPKGDTVIQCGDVITLSAPAYHGQTEIRLNEIKITPRHRWKNKQIQNIELASYELILLICRGMEYFVPNGQTVIRIGDIVIISRSEG